MARDSQIWAEGESAKRCKARLERHQRTVERAVCMLFIFSVICMILTILFPFGILCYVSQGMIYIFINFKILICYSILVEHGSFPSLIQGSALVSSDIEQILPLPAFCSLYC